MEIFFDTLFNNIFFQVGLILLIALILHYFSNLIVGNVMKLFVRREKSQTKIDAKKREDTLTSIFSTIVRLLIWAIAAMAILDSLNFNITSIAAGAGVVGIVVGLGAQTTIRDYLAGVFILLENQYRVGDVVTLSGGATGMIGTSGEVEEITLRITKLRGLDGTLNVVRNGEASIVTNRTFKYANIVIDVGVSYDSDIDMVEKVMNHVGRSIMKDEALAEDIFEPITFLRVDNFSPSSVDVRAMGKVKPAKQWAVAGEYRRRLLKSFAKHNIEISFPQLVVRQKK